MNVQGDGVEVLGSGVRYYSAVPGTTGKMTLTGIGLGQCCVEKLDKFEARSWSSILATTGLKRKKKKSAVESPKRFS
jgi:hypothetical protein